MDYNEIITLMQLEAGAGIYQVQFLEGPVTSASLAGGYHYKETQGFDLERGDLVLVEAKDSYAIAKIVATPAMIDISLLQPGLLAKLRHIVMPLDLGDFHELKRREGEARNSLAMAEINERLDRMRERQGEALKRAQLALGSAEIKVPQRNAMPDLIEPEEAPQYSVEEEISLQRAIKEASQEEDSK